MTLASFILALCYLFAVKPVYQASALIKLSTAKAI
ncbi:hypothetical protein [Endozoicomonas acroporae]